MALIISFEGLPNSGKSTASRLLYEKLCQAGLKTVVFDADNFGDGVTIRSVANKYRPDIFPEFYSTGFYTFNRRMPLRNIAKAQMLSSLIGFGDQSRQLTALAMSQKICLS